MVLLRKTRQIVGAALFAALIFISTMFISIKLPNGYANLGDCFIIAAAFLLGPKYAAFSAAIGTSLADVCAGYALYAPATFVIKAIMAVCCGLILRKNRKSLGVLISSLVAEIIMVTGYFLYETVLYGVSGAVLSVLGNTMQGLLNIFAAYVLVLILRRYVSNYEINR